MGQTDRAGMGDISSGWVCMPADLGVGVGGCGRVWQICPKVNKLCIKVFQIYNFWAHNFKPHFTHAIEIQFLSSFYCKYDMYT